MPPPLLTRARQRLRAAPGREGQPFVRGRTLTGGAFLACALLAVLAFAGVHHSQPLDDDPPAERSGPLTARQPQLREALLTGEDLPPGPTAPATTPPPSRAPATTPPPPPPPAPAEDLFANLCQTLFEDPAVLPGLSPTESISRRTERRGGTVLRQALSVFDEDRAPQAYRRLHELARGCGEFPASLDGDAVTVLLRKLSAGGAGRAESAGDQTYAVGLTVRAESGTRSGWLVVDRVGPVISVLRHLEVGRTAAGALDAVRDAALAKLRALARLLPE